MTMAWQWMGYTRTHNRHENTKWKLLSGVHFCVIPFFFSHGVSLVFCFILACGNVIFSLSILPFPFHSIHSREAAESTMRTNRANKRKWFMTIVFFSFSPSLFFYGFFFSRPALHELSRLKFPHLFFRFTFKPSPHIPAPPSRLNNSTKSSLTLSLLRIEFIHCCSFSPFPTVAAVICFAMWLLSFCSAREMEINIWIFICFERDNRSKMRVFIASKKKEDFSHREWL